MYKSMKITSEQIDKHFETNNNANELRFIIEKIEEKDAFKNCRNRKIKALCLKSNHERDGNQETTFNEKHSSLFEPLKEHLETLDLKFSWNCDFNFLKDLKHLQTLILTNSVFLNGAQPVFNGANNCLTYLCLNNCKLKISDKTMFNDLKCLRTLDLTKVELDDQMLPDLFSKLKKLHTLTMNETRLKPTEDAFIHLENLRELKIEGIKIPEECSNIFVPLKSLDELVMGSTQIFNNDAFRRLKNLRRLRLNHFSTIEIDANFFDQHPNLESLDLTRLNLYDQRKKYKSNWIDLRALANLKSLKYLYLTDNKLKLDQDYEIFCSENLLRLDLSLIFYKCFMKGEIKLNETTFKRMKNLEFLNLSGNRIKLEGNCFQHLTKLKELNLSDTILDSKNEDFDILSSLKQLEKLEFRRMVPGNSFHLYRLSELVNLRTLSFEITQHDLEQFSEMLRIKRRRTGEAEEQQQDSNPTYDDLCYFILKDMKKLRNLTISECHLTYINKQTIGQMKDLNFLSLSRNDIRHIPDDTFDRLLNLEYIYLDGNPLQQIKLNRLFLKLNKLHTVSIGYAPIAIVDLMDEQFNFKNIVKIEIGSIRNLEKFYHSRRTYLQQNQAKVASFNNLPALDGEMKDVELMFRRIDFKINEIKSEKEKSIEQQVKPFIVKQIKLDPIEDNLNQVRQEMINKLKVIHDKSITKMNVFIKKYKQLDHLTEESIEEATQSAEKVLQSQAKLPIESYSILPKLSNFVKLTHSNAFKGMKLVKYAELMPNLLKELRNTNNQKKSVIIQITRAKSLFITEPADLINRINGNNNNLKSSDKCSFEIHDLYTGSIKNKRFDDNPSDISSLNSIIDTFSIVNEHLITVREHNTKYDSNYFLSKFKPERLEQNCSIECNVDSIDSVTGILLIDVFDIYLNKISQATIKYSNSNKAFVYTCGSNGILIQSRSKIDKNVSHTFALYSLKMKLTRDRIRVDFKRDNSAPSEFKPIKFDDNKCYIYKHNALEYSTSIMIYSFADSSLLHEINIFLPPEPSIYKTLAIDAENNNLYFTSAISQTINCFNWQTKELVKSHIRRRTTFNKLILAANDEQIILSNTTQNLVFNLMDNFPIHF